MTEPKEKLFDFSGLPDIVVRNVKISAVFMPAGFGFMLIIGAVDQIQLALARICVIVLGALFMLIGLAVALKFLRDAWYD